MVFRKIVNAVYTGRTKEYHLSGKPSVYLENGKVYKISIQMHSFIHNGWTIVRVYDESNKCITWVPYAVDYRRYWSQV